MHQAPSLPPSADPKPSGLSKLFEPVDIASLVLFRMMFGGIMIWEAYRYLAKGWVRSHYIRPSFFFKFYGFEWVQPWPATGMHAHFIVLGVLAACVCAGFLYRLTAFLLWLSFTYIFLLDQAQYLNHYYLVCLMSFLMIFMPAHRARSVDAWLRPALASETAPAWTLWLLRFQMGIVYFYAGIAKLNADWLRGEPVRAWISDRTGLPVIGPLLASEISVYFVAYGGLLLDLFVVPLLLWRPTRVPAFLASAVFHLLNKVLFSIGIFPMLALAATLLFFDPGWPRKLCLFFPPPSPAAPVPGPAARLGAGRRLALAAITVYVLIQVLVPLRHFLYPGSVHWTEEGHRFSWHMKLRDKEGKAVFRVTDPATGSANTIDPREYLQAGQARWMAGVPDMILQFAHHLARTLPRKGVEPLEVRVEARVSLNGRKPQLLIDPEVDLARVPRSLGAASWILPLEEPLPRPGAGRSSR